MSEPFSEPGSAPDPGLAASESNGDRPKSGLVGLVSMLLRRRAEKEEVVDDATRRAEINRRLGLDQSRELPAVLEDADRLADSDPSTVVDTAPPIDRETREIQAGSDEEPDDGAQTPVVAAPVALSKGAPQPAQPAQPQGSREVPSPADMVADGPHPPPGGRRRSVVLDLDHELS